MRRWTRLSPVVWERCDGLRIHMDGHIAPLVGGVRVPQWSAFLISHFCMTEAKRARALEPKPRRMLMLLADTLYPVDP